MPFISDLPDYLHIVKESGHITAELLNVRHSESAYSSPNLI